MVEPTAAIRLEIQRPPERMHDLARLVNFIPDLPHFLDTQSVRLRILALAQVELVLHDFREGAVRTLGDQDTLCVELHPGLERVLGLTVLIEPDVTRDDAPDGLAILAPDEVGTGEPGVDLDARGLGLFGEPGGEAGKGDDVVALVVHLWWVGHRERVVFRQETHRIGQRGLVERCAEFLPVGEELVQRAGFDHGSGEDVGS